MRHLLNCLLLACALPATAQPHLAGELPFQDPDLEVMQGGAAWLVGDHVKARRHFRAAAQRGSPLGQYNLAMMLLYREGGPCDSMQAVALLRKSANAGVALARDPLDQVRKPITVTSQGRNGPFTCRLPSHRSSVQWGLYLPLAAPEQPTHRQPCHGVVAPVGCGRLSQF